MPHASAGELRKETAFRVPSDGETHISAALNQCTNRQRVGILLNATTSICVDGSFISRSKVPAAGPQESFESGAIDASVRITYHPVFKKNSRSDSYSNTAFLQRITVPDSRRPDPNIAELAD
ncbi:hypothetical protein C8J57DRAFT_1510132 [Mycena rebaudengoi]|nr:hypothetical protein C8J57DRAFT_1510132 [Mycena rebaudengoi]